MEKIIVEPARVRALGNIIDSDKSREDFDGYKCATYATQAIIDGEVVDCFTNLFSEYSLGLGFNRGSKELYISTDDDELISSFGLVGKCIRLDCDGSVITDFDLVGDEPPVPPVTYLFYDSGVTGTKNDDFLCTKSSSAYTLTTDSTGTVFVCTGGDGFYIPNIDIHNYSDLEITWTFTYGTRYACQVSLLNSNKGISNNQRWHNKGTSTPTTGWYTPSTDKTLTHTLTSGDTMKLVKENNTFSFYCNDELISTTTPSYDVYYIGFTSADGNRPFGYKELTIKEV